MRPMTIKVGDILPHNTRDFVQPHKVLDIRYDGPQVHVKTTEGRFTFSHNEKVRFPIRTDGSPKYFIATSPPTPLDLAVSDILGPPNPATAKNDEDELIEDPRTTNEWKHLGDSTQKDYLKDYEEQCIAAGEYQIISSITWPRADMAQIEVVYAKTGAIGRVNVPSYNTVQFPLPSAKKAHERREYNPVQRDFVKHGPYISRHSDRLVYFAVHPFGRGRWPNSIETHNHFGEQSKTIRPPKTSAEWALWFYEGELNERHPNDPEK